MKVERFQARDMAQAMAMIKEKLGPDAVILHTRQIHRGMLRQPWLEVIAARDQDEAREETARPTSNGEAAKEPAQAPSSGCKELRAMQAELSALREAITRLAGEVRSARLPALPPGLQQVYANLLARGVAEGLAADVVLAAAAELSPTAAEDLETARMAVSHHLRGRLAVRTLNPTARSAQVVFLVGPPGVGKTVTAAKLAGQFAREQYRRVALVSMDTYRIGAIDQLQAYGALMGIPTEVAYSPEELGSLIRGLGECDLILVDTPGRSRREETWLEELRRAVEAVPAPIMYLVLACTMGYPEMEAAARRFAGFSPAGVILTKADETERLGVAVSLACHTGLPVAYVAAGQEVPSDIQPASPEWLADQVTREPAEPTTSPPDGQGIPLGVYPAPFQPAQAVA